MTHIFENEKQWKALSVEEKLDELHSSIVKLFAIAEETSHKNHMFVDAVNLIHGRIDSLEKGVRRMESHTHHRELAE